MTFKIGSSTSTALKICGITSISQAKAIAAMGIDAIGVIGVDTSPRYLNESKRKDLFHELHAFSPTLERVWVIADLDNAQIKKALNGHGSPSVVQLHGNESKDRCKELRNKYPQTKWWKAIRIRTLKDLSIAREYENNVDALLLDAWSPRALGGSGQRIPLKWLKNTEFKTPWWLAGGISAEWIPDIFREVSPFGLDASSRLELKPGIKDIQKVHNLVKAMRSKES